MNHNFSATEYKNYKKDKNSKIRFKIILFLVMLNKNFFIFKRFTKFKTFSINFYKKKSNHFTLIKAPMAHKKFSKEQFTHQVNSFKIQCISNIYLYEILNTIKVVNLYNFYFWIVRMLVIPFSFNMFLTKKLYFNYPVYFKL